MEVRVGDSFGMNCLADFLLQCLVFHHMIETLQEETSDVQWRRRLCASARDYLCQHADDWLRPKQKMNTMLSVVLLKMNMIKHF